MPGKEYGQVDHHTDHGGGDAGQWRGEFHVMPGRLERRPADQDKHAGRPVVVASSGERTVALLE
jgi:hypothetical protein